MFVKAKKVRTSLQTSMRVGRTAVGFKPDILVEKQLYLSMSCKTGFDNSFAHANSLKFLLNQQGPPEAFQ